MAYSAKYDNKGLDAATSSRAGSFLFDTGALPPSFTKKERAQALLDQSRGLEMRARIKGAHTMAALSFYGILRDGFDSEAARIVGDVIKRLSVADEGEGRNEARDILRGQLPKEVEIKTGRA